MEKELEWHEADTQRRVVAHLCPPSCVYCTRWCVCALCVYLHDVVSFTVLRYLLSASATDNRAFAKVLSLFEMPQPDNRLNGGKTGN